MHFLVLVVGRFNFLTCFESGVRSIPFGATVVRFIRTYEIIFNVTFESATVLAYHFYTSVCFGMGGSSGFRFRSKITQRAFVALRMCDSAFFAVVVTGVATLHVGFNVTGVIAKFTSLKNSTVSTGMCYKGRVTFRFVDAAFFVARVPNFFRGFRTGAFVSDVSVHMILNVGGVIAIVAC